MKNIYYWLPRIIIVLFILFISLFSLDVFSAEGTVFEKIGGFLVHNVPVFIIILLLIFAQKRETMGGILFILMGVCFTFFFKTYERIDTFFLISFPLILSGILFLYGRRK